jgi:hypothetical protein
MLLQLVSFPCLPSLLIKRESLVCVNITKYQYKWDWTQVVTTLKTETVGRERTSLMLLQLVSSPICTNISVICTHTSGPRLMRRECRQGKDVFNVVSYNNIKDVLSMPTVSPHQT